MRAGRREAEKLALIGHDVDPHLFRSGQVAIRDAVLEVGGHGLLRSAKSREGTQDRLPRSTARSGKEGRSEESREQRHERRADPNRDSIDGAG